MQTWKWTRPWIWLLALAILAACQNAPAPDVEPQNLTEPSVNLGREQAAAGDEVRAELVGLSADSTELTADDIRLFVAGIETPVAAIDGHTFTFVVPEETPVGPQPVEIHLSGQTLHSSLNIVADSKADDNAANGLLPDLPIDLIPDDDPSDEFVLIVEPGTTVDTLTGLLEPLVFSVLEGPLPLGLAEGPCSGEFIRIEVLGLNVGGVLDDLVDIGEVLEILEGLEGEGPVWYSDPTSDYSSGTTKHSGATGVTQTKLIGNQTGAGTVIGVLDTGVSNHEELGSRLLTNMGYDFVDEDADPADAYGEVGHGTPIAVLAAGSSIGAAPGAQVLPVRVCDENGTCYTSDITLGLCHALATAENKLNGMENLVLNLSLGGETPNTAIEAILDYALQNGTLIAASGGNQGQEGSPPHYPAAYDMDGMVATTALQASGSNESEGGWRPASFSTQGGYLDIAAPGVNLTSGTPAGGYHSDYDGTSFATALTSGALALWSEANPGMSPAEVEAGLKAAARPLHYPEDAVGAGMLELSGVIE